MNGGGGMPSFGRQLSADEIENVAAFVVASRGFDR
jgi:mono/diheme cytochrome c family protein